MGHFNMVIKEAVAPTPKWRAILDSVFAMVRGATFFVLGASYAILALHLTGEDQTIQRIWELVRLRLKVG